VDYTEKIAAGPVVVFALRELENHANHGRSAARKSKIHPTGTVFTKPVYANHFDITLIDQGHCFNCGEWNFPECALHGVY